MQTLKEILPNSVDPNEMNEMAYIAVFGQGIHFSTYTCASFDE